MSVSKRLIPRAKSVIVAADVEAEKLSELVRGTCLVKGIGGYKIGFELGLEQGLPKTVAVIKEETGLPVIYDHQKAGTDIPDTGESFAKVCKDSGVDAVILFPFGGGETGPAWIKACQDKGLVVLVGAHMTQPKFLWEEGGVIHEGGPDRIFTLAAEEGVRNFVVPGNKVEYVLHYKELFEDMLGAGNFTLYAPGFITQGGEISDLAQVAGDNWHAIVGREINKAVNFTEAAQQMTRQIR